MLRGALWVLEGLGEFAAAGHPAVPSLSSAFWSHPGAATLHTLPPCLVRHARGLTHTPAVPGAARTWPGPRCRRAWRRACSHMEDLRGPARPRGRCARPGVVTRWQRTGVGRRGEHLHPVGCGRQAWHGACTRDGGGQRVAAAVNRLVWLARDSFLTATARPAHQIGVLTLPDGCADTTRWVCWHCQMGVLTLLDGCADNC